VKGSLGHWAVIALKQIAIYVLCCVMLCHAVLFRAQAEDLFRQQSQRDVDRVMEAKQREELK
jgi:hypothetical protein